MGNGVVGILLVGIIICGFGLLAVWALLAFITGETVRAEQQTAVDRYVAERTEHLQVLRVRNCAREEAEKQQAEVMARKTKHEPSLPEDKQLLEDIRFMQQVASGSPQVFASVVRSYLAGDPDAVAYTPVSDFEPLDMPGQPDM